MKKADRVFLFEVNVLLSWVDEILRQSLTENEDGTRRRYREKIGVEKKETRMYKSARFSTKEGEKTVFRLSPFCRQKL